jgi:hypothetical protein
VGIRHNPNFIYEVDAEDRLGKRSAPGGSRGADREEDWKCGKLEGWRVAGAALQAGEYAHTPIEPQIDEF